MFKASIGWFLERSNQEESKKDRENAELLAEARKDIYERDEKLEELKMEYESRLKVKTESFLQSST